ncbi:hypothetical protein [Oricola thermophila]|uniref:Uncharacterized protein n=1 Tax=Oricola thermophila TaxID=2742145 RepID=A0A6N1VFA2_9HYPH|nr:hypothetical protein [Oricola thermophila]QKV17829.1 hypothetical protein HTY61_04830 [Oricola thermophila]
MINRHLLTATQIAFMTKLTREGVRDMTNRKPYRTKAMKAEARRTAYVDKNGAWRSTAPTQYHPDSKERGPSY